MTTTLLPSQRIIDEFRPRLDAIMSAVTGLLALARRFPHYWAAQQRGQWSPLKAAEVPDLHGQTAIIIGTGHIGKVIAGCLQAFGLRTIGVRRRPEPVAHFDRIVPLTALGEHLPGCDWLVLACPLVDATGGSIDARRLALLPRTAGSVNIARNALMPFGCDRHWSFRR